jgi:hypothetical protein
MDGFFGITAAGFGKSPFEKMFATFAAFVGSGGLPIHVPIVLKERSKRKFHKGSFMKLRIADSLVSYDLTIIAEKFSHGLKPRIPVLSPLNERVLLKIGRFHIKLHKLKIS